MSGAMEQPGHPSGSSSLPPCAVCGGRITRPLLLPCLHSACYTCVSARHAMTCPLCPGDPTTHTHRHMEDPYMRHILEIEACREDSPKPCDYCRHDDVTTTAEYRCLECRDNLCSSCSDAHRRTKLTRGHTLMSFKELQCGGQKSGNDIRGHQLVLCGAHASEVLRYYCLQCDHLVCRECKVTEHEKHSCALLEDEHRSFQQKTAPILEDIGRKTCSVQEQLHQMDEYLSHVNETRGKLASEVDACAAALHQAVSQHRDTLLSQLNQAAELENARVKEKQTQAKQLQDSLKAATSYGTKLLDDGKAAEILSVRPLVKERLTKLLYSQVAPLDTKLGLHFTSNPASLLEKSVASIFGKVEIHDTPVPSTTKQEAIGTCQKSTPGSEVALYNSTPSLHEAVELVTSFECSGQADTKDIWPTGAVVHPDTGLLYVVDRENKCVKVWETPTGRLVREFGRGCLGCPYDITVLQAGHIAVSDHQEENIKIFTLTGELIDTLKDGIKYPRGIATDFHGNLIIVDAHNRQLKVIEPTNGKEVKIISGRSKDGCDLFNEPYYVTVNKAGFIIATDWASPHIKWFTPEGIYLSHYGDYGCNQDQLLQPYGVVVDGNGCILVADNQNHRVHLLTPDGKFLRFLVTKQHGLWHPMALAFNKQGHLVITEALGKIKIFKYQ